MPRKIFVAGEILTAADVNTNLMDQAVMVFDDATARTTAIPTPVEGMVTYLKDTNLVQAFTGSAFTAVGGIVQVVSVTKTNVFNTSAEAFQDIPGLAAAITPGSTGSKVLIFGTLTVGSADQAVEPRFDLQRNTTSIGVGDAEGSRVRIMSGSFMRADTGAGTGEQLNTVSFNFFDSPATTSETTYKMRMSVRNGRLGHINRSGADGNTADIRNARGSCTITVMEVAG